jgi:hypothetical protein
VLSQSNHIGETYKQSIRGNTELKQ